MNELNGADHQDLYDTFAVSKFGIRLSEKARFDAKGMKPSWVTVDQWHDLLGDDVNNLHHLSRSVEVVDLYEQLDEGSCPEIPEEYPALRSFFPSKYDVLRAVGAIHDIQESIVGDINYHDKNGESEKQERIAFMMLSSWLFGETLSYDLRHEIASIAFDKKSALGKEFNIVESMGYVMTALKGEEVYSDNQKVQKVFGEISDKKNGELKYGLHNIVLNVLPYQIPQLVDMAGQSSAVRNFLVDRAREISESFMLIPESKDWFKTVWKWEDFCQNNHLTPHYDTSSCIAPSLTHFA